MRTSLTLDDDVEAKLRAEARKSGLPFEHVVNEALRASLHRRSGESSTPFKVRPKDFGRLRPGLSLDNIRDLLETLEGPLHR